MEYIFGTVRRYGKPVETVKTVGDKHSDLSGRVTVKREYPDRIIEDSFTIVDKYESKESNGKCYDWYFIESHYRDTDRFMPQKEDIDSKIDYIAMMADIEMEEEDGIEELSEN